MKPSPVLDGVFQRCDGPCRGLFRLLVRCPDRSLCPWCWEAAGQPEPIPRENRMREP
jgi:hypothetical protein